jgi:hypothetical protein
MSKFKLYQNHPSRALLNEANRLGREDAMLENPQYKAYVMVNFSGGSKYYKPWMFAFYENVSDIEAESLDGVFEVGNIGPEENITRYLPMHSVSVGDIIETPDGEFWMVDGCGFNKVEIK